MVSKYIDRVCGLCADDPPVSMPPMRKENMPGYRQPHNPNPNADDPCDPIAQSVLASILIDNSNGHSAMLSHVPVLFGSFEPSIDLPTVYRLCPLYNAGLVAAARYIMEFHWAVYSFNSGHFIASMRRESLPFRITLAVDPLLESRSCFKEFAKCNKILSNAPELLDHTRSSGNTSPLSGYLINGPQLLKRTDARSFLQLQTSIILQMRTICGLSMFLVLLLPENHLAYVKQFITTLKLANWCVSSSQLHCSDFGNSYDLQLHVLFSIH